MDSLKWVVAKNSNLKVVSKIIFIRRLSVITV